MENFGLWITAKLTEAHNIDYNDPENSKNALARPPSTLAAVGAGDLEQAGAGEAVECPAIPVGWGLVLERLPDLGPLAVEFHPQKVDDNQSAPAP